MALGIAAVRAGLALKFRGKIFLIFLLILIPQILESTTVALLAMKLFEFPISTSFALGFCLASTAPAVIVPAMIGYQMQGFGTRTGIPGMLISGSTFDIVLVFIFFGICKGVALNDEI